MSDRLFVATRKGLFRLDRRPGDRPDWRVTGTSFLAEPVSLILPDPRDSRLYAALKLGHFGVKLHRSEDAGETWTECAAPAFPEGEAPSGWKDEYAKNADKAPAVSEVWALAAADPATAGHLWLGTIPGGLFRSTDGGDSWALVRSLWDHPDRKEWFGGGAEEPGIHSICVDPRDPRQVRVGVSCGGVWETLDNGETWNCRADGMRAEYMPPDLADKPTIQDPHRMVQCRARPDVFWVQHHNGIFRSTDCCASWREITTGQPSNFGFAVAVHPEDPETAWFVPAVKDQQRIPVDGKVVVSRTRDGGKTFEVLREGLPQEHAYDLAYRHALDIDASGDRLAFGSTTGSLWLTENRGEAWACLSTHLPPIYAVRFAP